RRRRTPGAAGGAARSDPGCRGSAGVKVILRADVADVGHKGDVLDVADGYARNFLVPRGLAMAASKGALAQAESMRRARAVRDARDREAAEEVATKLTPLTIKIPARAGAEGRLFGSVTPADVAQSNTCSVTCGQPRRCPLRFPS